MKRRGNERGEAIRPPDTHGADPSETTLLALALLSARPALAEEPAAGQPVEAPAEKPDLSVKPLNYNDLYGPSAPYTQKYRETHVALGYVTHNAAT